MYIYIYNITSITIIELIWATARSLSAATVPLGIASLSTWRRSASQGALSLGAADLGRSCLAAICGSLAGICNGIYVCMYVHIYTHHTPSLALKLAEWHDS